MRRRRFLGLLGGASVAALVPGRALAGVLAAPERVPGVLEALSREYHAAPALSVAELEEAGFPVIPPRRYSSNTYWLYHARRVACPECSGVLKNRDLAVPNRWGHREDCPRYGSTGNWSRWRRPRRLAGRVGL